MTTDPMTTDIDVRKLTMDQLLHRSMPGMVSAALEFVPLQPHLDYETCWALLSALQLALAHPRAKEFACMRVCRDFAEELALRIATTPETKEIVRRGWEQRS